MVAEKGSDIAGHEGEKIQGESQEELFDLIIPPGVPRKIIVQIISTFDVEMVTRKERLYFANMEGDEREILAFRGRREVVEQVQDYMKTELDKFIGSD